MLYVVNRLIHIAYVKGHSLYIHVHAQLTSGHRNENIAMGPSLSMRAVESLVIMYVIAA